MAFGCIHEGTTQRPSTFAAVSGGDDYVYWKTQVLPAVADICARRMVPTSENPDKLLYDGIKADHVKSLLNSKDPHVLFVAAWCSSTRAGLSRCRQVLGSPRSAVGPCGWWEFPTYKGWVGGRCVEKYRKVSGAAIVPTGSGDRKIHLFDNYEQRKKTCQNRDGFILNI